MATDNDAREKLLDTIGKKLDESPDVDDSGTVEETEKAETPETPATPDPVAEEPAQPESDETSEPTKQTTPPESTDQESTEEEPETPAQPSEAAADKSAPTLPDAFRRSLVANQWTEQEIDEAFKENPTLFLKVASKVHDKRNREIAAFAERGRQQKQQQPQNDRPAQPPAAPEKTTPANPLAKAREVYGDEDPAIQAIDAVAQKAQEAADAATAAQQRASQHETAALGKVIDNFFGSDSLKPFHDRFGTDTSKLTPAQQKDRWEVLVLADAIVGGAAQQGISMTAEEALMAAVDSVTAKDRERVAREQIVKSVQQRQKGLSLKPTAARPSSVPKDPRAAVLAHIKSKLKRR